MFRCANQGKHWIHARWPSSEVSQSVASYPHNIHDTLSQVAGIISLVFSPPCCYPCHSSAHGSAMVRPVHSHQVQGDNSRRHRPPENGTPKKVDSNPRVQWQFTLDTGMYVGVDPSSLLIIIYHHFAAGCPSLTSTCLSTSPTGSPILSISNSMVNNRDVSSVDL